MTITGAFRRAVSMGDLRGIRIMMKDSLLVDLTFEEFKEMDDIARGVSGLYEAHDGRDLDDNTSAWNDNYMNKLMVQVVGNFSERRVEHLKKVVRHLRPPIIGQTRKAPPTREPYLHLNGQEQKREDKQSRRANSDRGVKRGITKGAVAGGVIGGAIAKVASVSVFVGAVAGAVVVGAVVAVAKKMGLRNE